MTPLDRPEPSMLKHALFVAVVVNPCGAPPEPPSTRCDSAVEDCSWDTAENAGEIRCSEPDKDNDGYHALGCGSLGVDCDDHNPAIHPDADEVCDEVDDDCDGSLDCGQPQS